MDGDFRPPEPKLCRKEASTMHSVPRPVHFVDAGTQIVNANVLHRQGEKDGPVSWEVLVETRESLEEAPAPCPAPAPLAEGAETPVAGVSRPKESFAEVRPLDGDLHANRRRAIADRFRDVQRLGVHRQGLADGCVVPPVFTERLQHGTIRVGRGSNTAWTCKSMHRVIGFRQPHAAFHQLQAQPLQKPA